MKDNQTPQYIESSLKEVFIRIQCFNSEWGRALLLNDFTDYCKLPGTMAHLVPRFLRDPFKTEVSWDVFHTHALGYKPDHMFRNKELPKGLISPQDYTNLRSYIVRYLRFIGERRRLHRQLVRRLASSFPAEIVQAMWGLMVQNILHHDPDFPMAL